MDLREVPSQPFQRHPWEVARARFFLGVLEQSGVLRQSPRILDVGSGDAYFAQELVRRIPTSSANVTCLDPYYTDVDLARRGGGIHFARERDEGARFDLLLLLDVLEHVPNDQVFLRELVTESLFAGASVLVSVPAWARLFSHHDIALGHHRRYTPAACKRVLEHAGLRVVLSGGLFHSLLVPRALERAKELVSPRKPNGDPSSATEAATWTGGPLLGGVVDAALRLDNAVSRVFADARLDVPGLSYWALCKKD